MRRPSLVRPSVALLVALLRGTVLVAQATTDSASTDTTKRLQTLFTYRDAILAAGFAGLTVAMLPADEYVAAHLRDQRTPANRALDRVATGVEMISSPGPLIIGPALYAYGRIARHPGVADLGWHGTEAVLLGSGVTGLLKALLGRSRPFVSADTNARDFAFGRGFRSSDWQSFPSGHTTSAFAAAAAVTSEVQRMWPRYTWYVAPVMYGGATLVGLSRMYHNKHWTSDVVLAAGVGTFSGLKVVRYSHAHPDNVLDRLILRTSVAPDGRGGAIVAWTIPLPH